MSTMTFDSTDMTLDIDLSELQDACKPKAKKEPKSLQELKVHYLNFCAVRDLDPTIDPEELVVYCDKDQKWLDLHLEHRALAIKQKRLLARGKIPFLRQMLAKIQAMIGNEEDSDVITRDTVNATPYSEHQIAPPADPHNKKGAIPRFADRAGEPAAKPALATQTEHNATRCQDILMQTRQATADQPKKTHSHPGRAHVNAAQLSLF